MFTLLCAISIQILKFFCKDRRLLLYMSRTLHLFGTDWCAMMVPIQVIRWYRMQCYDGTDSCATVVPIRRYCQLLIIASCRRNSSRSSLSLYDPFGSPFRGQKPQERGRKPPSGARNRYAIRLADQSGLRQVVRAGTAWGKVKTVWGGFAIMGV